ncbi:MAG TPA: lysine--tRNA ligase [Caulobacteraceae bacterium]|jgi:lysyl-tRNA synthetase class 1|nr:lysine--tRNA ligase [Caulobacteraceae bacterium]
MLKGLSPLARTARPWPFEQARNTLARILRIRLSEDERDLAAALFEQDKFEEAIATLPALGQPVLFQTGYGASGLPHIGTFNEVARTTMVRNAFRTLTNDVIPTRLISFADDMDALRKVPENVPNRELLAEDLGKPLTSVRDPFGEHESFGAHNNARMRAFLDEQGFDYEFLSSTECYRAGRFDHTLRLMLERFDAVQAVMLPTLGPERRATYSPFLPISPTTGRVLQVPTLERHVDRGTIVFEDEDGRLTEISVTGGAVKLQWKPDWACRWAAFGVDYEMAGKDLIDSVKVSSRICTILGGEPPEGFNFELFLDDHNQKISKSKGNGLTLEEWRRYGTPESLVYYLFQSPRSAKKLYFDVIPKATDEYLQQLDAYNARPAEGGNKPANPLDNPVWSVHDGSPPSKGSPVSFSLLLNLVSAANASDKSILWGFISRQFPGASPQTEPLLDRLADYAVHYYEDFVRPSKRFRPPDARERAAFADLLARLKALPADCHDGETIQNEVYGAGKDAGFDPLRTWFGALYEVLLGQAQGPRFGSFAAIFGLPGTIRLIESALEGSTAQAEAL